MKHFSEEELIAYQLHESSNEAAISPGIWRDAAECAELSESIAETLRVFSADPAPQPDLERNWQRLRGNLSVLTLRNVAVAFELLRRHWAWPAVGLATAALVLLTVIRSADSIAHRRDKTQLLPSMAMDHSRRNQQDRMDPAIANHLDAAERLSDRGQQLPGTLDDTTREQAHTIFCSRTQSTFSNARDSGDLAEAAVLENFGRVLTTLDNEPPTPHSTWRLRLEMNTSGLLLDIRILATKRRSFPRSYTMTNLHSHHTLLDCPALFPRRARRSCVAARTLPSTPFYASAGRMTPTRWDSCDG